MFDEQDVKYVKWKRTGLRSTSHGAKPSSFWQPIIIVRPLSPAAPIPPLLFPHHFTEAHASQSHYTRFMYMNRYDEHRVHNPRYYSATSIMNVLLSRMIL